MKRKFIFHRDKKYENKLYIFFNVCYNIYKEGE